MKGLWWNCRGGINDLRFFIIFFLNRIFKSNCFGFLFFCEIKVDVDSVFMIFKKYFFAEWTGYDAIDIRGGFWMGWK